MNLHKNLYIICISILLLSTPILCDDDDNSFEFEGVFMGEGPKGIGCEGVFSNVDASGERMVVEGEGQVEAISEAIIEQIEMVENNKTAEAVYAAAKTSSELVLTVVATAVAKVEAEINSPTPGCWAIAFGKAEAVAIAEATVRAVAYAFASANLEDAVVELASETVENDLKIAIAEVALLLADGSGAGPKSDNINGTATAEATAINCALGEAFAKLLVGESEAIGLAQTGCIKPVKRPTDTIFQTAQAEYGGCGCIDDEHGAVKDFNVPSLCGQYGDEENKDYICYVQDVYQCLCSEFSERFREVGVFGWRYCGPTLETMQTYLSSELWVLPEEWSRTSSGGYCHEWNWKEDTLKVPVVPSPTPSPSPSPSPTPASPTPPESPEPPVPELPRKVFQKDCPFIRCIGDMQSCCGLEEEICTSKYGRRFFYEGECKETGQQVWSRSVGSDVVRGSFGYCACIQQ